MVFEQLLQNGVCYAYLMRMLEAVLTTFDLLPLVFNRGPFEGTVAFCGAYAKIGVFLPVLHTPFSVRLYAACMRAYAAYIRPQNIELHSIWQKKHPIICVCAVFVVPLHKISNQ